jgi:lysophospholipase L1-like esterase
MGKLKTVLKVVRQLFIILLITAVLAEIAFRIYNYFRPSFIFYDQSYNQFRGKPNAQDYDFHLNSKGFKDLEFTVEKVTGRQRIVALGDSFAYGIVPYQNNYLTLLEEGLNQKGKRAEVINMGIAGTGPKDYLALLKNEGLELQPDMVLVSFFIGNDFLQEKEERKLYSYSYLASFINYVVTLGQGYEGKILNIDGAYDDNASTFTEPKYIELETKRSEIYRQQDQGFQNDLAGALNYLRQIKQVCDERRMKLAVLVIPDEIQVNRNLQTRVKQVKAFNSGVDDYDFTLPNRQLAAGLKELGIPYLDVLDDFVRAASGTTLYRPNDSHWNIAGNKLAAEALEKWILDLDKGATNQSSAPVASSTFEGFHDDSDCQAIRGWAWDTRHPNEPVQIEFYEGNVLIGKVLANRFRKDLRDAGKGNGEHAFEFAVPPRLKDNKEHQIRATIAGTQTQLTYTPRTVQCPAK